MKKTFLFLILFFSIAQICCAQFVWKDEEQGGLIAAESISATPFQFGLCPPIQLFESNVTVLGVSISPFAVNGSDVYGVEVAACASRKRLLAGVSVSGIFNMTSLNFGIVAGLWNQSALNDGIMIGLINIAGGDGAPSYGIQIGLINITLDSFCPFLPGINWNPFPRSWFSPHY